MLNLGAPPPTGQGTPRAKNTGPFASDQWARNTSSVLGWDHGINEPTPSMHQPDTRQGAATVCNGHAERWPIVAQVLNTDTTSLSPAPCRRFPPGGCFIDEKHGRGSWSEQQTSLSRGLSPAGLEPFHVPARGVGMSLMLIKSPSRPGRCCLSFPFPPFESFPLVALALALALLRPSSLSLF